MDALTRTRLFRAKGRGRLLFVAPSSVRDKALGAYVLRPVKEGDVLGTFPTKHKNVVDPKEYDRVHDELKYLAENQDYIPVEFSNRAVDYLQTNHNVVIHKTRQSRRQTPNWRRIFYNFTQSAITDPGIDGVEQVYYAAEYNWDTGNCV